MTLDWMNGQDADGVLERVDPRVELLEGPRDVHVLLRTARADHRSGNASWTTGTRRGNTTTFELSAPLGRRRLLSDQRIPPVNLTLLPVGQRRPTNKRPA